MKKTLKQLLDGIFTNNPVVVQLIGRCPTLATTTSLQNAIGMGLAAAAVLVCSNVVISLLACVLVGIFTSMLWPGSLIMMEEKFPGIGVAAYALMAAGGDFGASIAPQMMGVIVDTVSVSSWATELSTSIGMTPDQIGMKTGMLFSAIFPLIGTFVVLYIIRYFKKQKA